MSNYVLEGEKWTSFTISWSFATQTLARDTADPFSSSITDAATQAMVEKALARWQSVSGISFVQVADSASADIRFGWGVLGSGASGEIGDTTYYSSNGVMQSDVVIRFEDPSQMPLVPSAAGLIYSGTASTLYQVMLHEIGHSLGLDHDADAASIMYPVAGSGNRDLDQTDVAGVQSMYGLPAPVAASAAIISSTPAAAANAVSAASGSGLVSVHLQGSHSQYTIVATPGGAMQISDMVGGRDGTQTIAHAGDLVFADGQGRFDPDGAAENIYRLYTAALGRNADAGGLDYWTAQYESGASMTAIATGLASSPEFIARTGASTNGLYVQALYQQVLGHTGDAGGIAYWAQLLSNGNSRGQVLLSFANSDETRALVSGVAGDVNDAQVARLYQAAFGHAPNVGGDFYWSDLMRQGATPSAIAGAFLASSEHAQIYGSSSDQDFVSSLYQNALDRSADRGGLAYWSAQLAGGASRADVMIGFADSMENRTVTASATHANWVFLG